jgi:hypothetical protein
LCKNNRAVAMSSAILMRCFQESSKLLSAKILLRAPPYVFK